MPTNAKSGALVGFLPTLFEIGQTMLTNSEKIEKFVAGDAESLEWLHNFGYGVTTGTTSDLSPWELFEMGYEFASNHCGMVVFAIADPQYPTIWLIAALDEDDAIECSKARQESW